MTHVDVILIPVAFRDRFRFQILNVLFEVPVQLNPTYFGQVYLEIFYNTGRSMLCLGFYA